MTFFQKPHDESELGRLFTPGNRLCFECGNKKIMYVALDPRQKPPEKGLFQPWISVEDALPPPARSRCEQYLVYVRSGGGPYGDYEYNIDFAWWGEYWNKNDHGYDWTCICSDWDGDVTITHWMPLPEPPDFYNNTDEEEPEE